MLKTHSDFLSTVTVKCQFFRSRFRQTACTILSTKSKSVCSSKKMEILDELSNIYVNLKTGVLKIGAIINIIYILSQQQDVNGCNQGEQHCAVSTRGTSSFIFWCSVKPLLSGSPFRRTPSLKRTLSRVPKLTSTIFLYNEPVFSGHLYLADADTKINCIRLIFFG